MSQQGQPTVGDTITLVRRIFARSGTVIDARAPADSSIATLIGAPVLTREGDSVQIAYTVAVWTAGHSDLVLPGAVLVDQRGHVDTLPDARIPLDVASVLPAAKSNTLIKPQSAQPWLPRGDRSTLPFIVLVPLALIVIGFIHWRWRRRGPLPPQSSALPVRGELTQARLNAWIAAGESRLALEHIDAMVRGRDDLVDWQERVAAVRFAPADDAVVTALVREAWDRLAPATS